MVVQKGGRWDGGGVDWLLSLLNSELVVAGVKQR